MYVNKKICKSTTYMGNKNIPSARFSIFVVENGLSLTD